MMRHYGLALAVLAGIAIALSVWQPWRSTSATPADPPKFAQDRKPEGAPVKAIPFDGDRAMKYLKELCDLGPRISGSDGMKKQQDLLIRHFEKHGGVVEKQTFEGKAKSQAKPVAMMNLIARWHPEKPKRILLSAHYDTRPQADEESDRTRWNKPFLSANDGTSGVAFLMEMAHHLNDMPCEYGIDIVLFDAEEYIFVKGQFYGDGDDFFLGSEHFGREYDKNRKKLPWSYAAGVNFDLFAAKDARLAVEGYSWSLAAHLVDEIWKTAAAVNAKSFVYERGFRRAVEVLDDHIALNRYGIPAIDIIDFDYKHWHLLTDLPEQCSAEQMSEVARVITTWLQQKK